VLNIPSDVKARIEAMLKGARCDQEADLCRRALAGEHTAFMGCMRVISRSDKMGPTSEVEK